MNREEFERLGVRLKHNSGVSEMKLFVGDPNYMPHEKFLGSLAGVYDLYWAGRGNHGLVGWYQSQYDYLFLYVPEYFGTRAEVHHDKQKKQNVWYLPALKLAKKKGLYQGAFA
jgi:hypothetical protein